MHYVHNLDPILLSLGPLTVRWYGFMYLTGFTLAFFWFRKKYRDGFWSQDPAQSQDLITYLMIGMIIGARFLYVFIYNPEILQESFWNLFAVWQGGLSYHGAALGFIVAMFLYAKKYKIDFFHVTDYVVHGAALGVFFGRIGNFINGELYGRVSDVPWAVVFPTGGNSPRHPSQIYQSLGEGLSVFIILLLIERWERSRGNAPQKLSSPRIASAIEEKKDTKNTPKQTTQVWKRTGVMGFSYLALYGIARFVVEFFREPDVQMGYYFGWMTMGQILCSIMIIVGVAGAIARIRASKGFEFEVQ